MRDVQATNFASLIEPHQTAVARHIGGEDGSKTTLDGLLHGLSQPR
jgi:hypothetical protein